MTNLTDRQSILKKFNQFEYFFFWKMGGYLLDSENNFDIKVINWEFIHKAENKHGTNYTLFWRKIY
jgi:hypothetical protein